MEMDLLILISFSKLLLRKFSFTFRKIISNRSEKKFVEAFQMIDSGSKGQIGLS